MPETLKSSSSNRPVCEKKQSQECALQGEMDDFAASWVQEQKNF
jgi:hypothetical protein